MKPGSKDSRIAKVLKDLIPTHPEWLNSEYAEAAAALLGENVDGKDVSRVRNQIGLGWYDLLSSRIHSKR